MKEFRFSKEEELKELEEKLSSLKEEKEKEFSSFLEDLKKEGWFEFNLFHYQGGNEVRWKYLFAPHIDLSLLHGEMIDDDKFGCYDINIKFFEYINTLEENKDYIVIK